MPGLERNPHAGNAGLVTGARTAPGGTWVNVYDGPEQGIPKEDGGRWAIVCEAHGTLLQVTNKRQAVAIMRAGSTEFCDCCRGTCVTAQPWLDQCPDCGRRGGQ